MSLGKTWFTPEEAESKVGIGRDLILKWVEDGLVRCEREEGHVVRVNIDDVNLKVEALTKKD
ncbi:MAG: MerR family transcriptional regulator [Syntrophotaleaceae bacterium]